MNAPMGELSRHLLEQMSALNERFLTGIRQGQDAERQHYAPLMQAARGVIAAYDRATKDDLAKMPTMLHITIEAMKVSMPEFRARAKPIE